MHSTKSRNCVIEYTSGSGHFRKGSGLGGDSRGLTVFPPQTSARHYPSSSAPPKGGAYVILSHSVITLIVLFGIVSPCKLATTPAERRSTKGYSSGCWWITALGGARPKSSIRMLPNDRQSAVAVMLALDVSPPPRGPYPDVQQPGLSGAASLWTWAEPN